MAVVQSAALLYSVTNLVAIRKGLRIEFSDKESVRTSLALDESLFRGINLVTLENWAMCFIDGANI